ncbi:hypothetical protein BKA70DRAFT_1050875, partial [Coprinopsis sp. MPI-PUGE-AT-0042]
GAVVSGSAALAVIEPGIFQPADLDKYVPRTSASAFKTWIEAPYKFKLEQAHGRGAGETQKERRSDYCSVSGIERIWYFSSDRCDRLVNVMITTTLSPLPAIICFHSTTVMNFITYYGVVNFYLELIRRRVGWFNSAETASRRDIRWIDNYNRRGCRVLGDLRLVGKHVCGSSPSCTQTIRNLFDEGVEIAKFREYCYTRDITLLKSTERVFVWK